MAHSLSGHPSGLSILAGGSTGLSDDEARILRGLRSGIEEAYEELISRYEQQLYGMIYRLLGNPTDAADVVQEVFLKVFRGINSFREQSSLRTWIYRIAVNEAHNHRRWFARHCQREVPFPYERDEPTCSVEYAADPGRSPYEQVLDSEHRSLIERALTRINPVFRT